MPSKPRFLLLGTTLLAVLALTPAEASTASPPCSETATAISDPAATVAVASSARGCYWRGPYRCCTYAVSKHQFVKRCMRARTR